MEYVVMNKISKAINDNKKAALVTITKIKGSVPGKKGFIMAVFEDGSIEGTIGGGNLENTVIKEALKCMNEGDSRNYNYKLKDELGMLNMTCGGEVDVFIKVFKPNNKLVIVGGGHVGEKLYELGKKLEFYTVIFDDREEFVNKERFPKADELIFGDIKENLTQYNIDSNCYIVIVTRGHLYDEIALESVINSGANYIGMIGSKKKVYGTMENLKNKGIDKSELEKIYAPIGINLGGETPLEIAFSIMAEILLVKNKGTLQHMKDRKRLV